MTHPARHPPPEIGDTTPLLLDVAARMAFPDGGMSGGSATIIVDYQRKPPPLIEACSIFVRLNRWPVSGQLGRRIFPCSCRPVADVTDRGLSHSKFLGQLCAGQFIRVAPDKFNLI